MNTTFKIEVSRDLHLPDNEEFGRACEIIEELKHNWSDAIFENWDITGDWDNVGCFIRYPNITLYVEGRETSLEERAQDAVCLEYNEVNDILNRCINQVLAALNDGV